MQKEEYFCGECSFTGNASGKCPRCDGDLYRIDGTDDYGSIEEGNAKPCMMDLEDPDAIDFGDGLSQAV